MAIELWGYTFTVAQAVCVSAGIAAAPFIPLGLWVLRQALSSSTDPGPPRLRLPQPPKP
jgi:hypothetical protein